MFDALGYALAELDDPLLDELALVSVEPAPGASRVLVTLAPSSGAFDAEAALERLRAITGELRAEVAAEVTRRRVPELVFRIAPASDGTVHRADGKNA
ncbi:MAG TPA: hypothetical protein VLX92_00815 [Kofleriaceae bacterium]|nr:hypothetical protein [Kofleriaceae bacterium]